MLRMDTGSEFEAVGPAAENTRSPNLVKVNGTVSVRVAVDECSPCRRDDAAIISSVYDTVAHHSTMGDRSFSVAAACVWNSLPSDITLATSLLAFRRVLKTDLFCRSFSDN